MNVTREVIMDLVPLYVSGEASGDTRTLVEEFLARDAELRRRTEEFRRLVDLGGSPAAAAGDAELNTVRRARRWVSLRGLLLGASLFLTLLPLSMEFDAHGVRWIWSDRPGLALLSGVLGLAGWLAYFVLRRRLRSVGL